LSGRRLGATVIGILAGATGFTTLMLAGWLLYQRLWGDSAAALVVIVALFGAAGLYAGWILGIIVFSAVSGPSDGGENAA
jgi:hypothetical protein